MASRLSRLISSGDVMVATSLSTVKTGLSVSQPDCSMERRRSASIGLITYHAPVFVSVKLSNSRAVPAHSLESPGPLRMVSMKRYEQGRSIPTRRVKCSDGLLAEVGGSR